MIDQITIGRQIQNYHSGSKMCVCGVEWRMGLRSKGSQISFKEGREMLNGLNALRNILLFSCLYNLFVLRPGSESVGGDGGFG